MMDQPRDLREDAWGRRAVTCLADMLKKGRPKSTRRLAPLAVLIVVSCAATNAADNLSGGADAGTVDASVDGGKAGTQFGGDGSAYTAVNPQGAACHKAGQTAACWTGPAAKRNMGGCHDGMTTCVANGEFATWGPCIGEVTTCSDSGTGGFGAEDSGGQGTGGGGAEDSGVETGPGSGGGGLEGCMLADTKTFLCPAGTYGQFQNDAGPSPSNPLGDPYWCCPCTASDCGDPTKPACCLASVCAGAGACASCAGAALDPSCNGKVDWDCDDFPEDCDELCCPCKPASTCVSCPPGQIACNGLQGGTDPSQCVDAVSNPLHCGACDTLCNGSCVNGVCQ